MHLTRTAALVWSAGEALAARFDALPVSPYGVGTRLLARAHRQRQASSVPRRQRTDPWWTPAAGVLVDARAVVPLQSVRHLVQRAVRGWSDDDVAELATVLPATLGAQLLVLADRAERRIRDPDDPDRPAAVAFAEQLRAHGRVLAAQGDPEGEVDRTSTAWHDVATRAGHDRGLEARLAGAHRRAVADASQAARDSLVWVAHHLDDLWD